jgi:hypothetical protein
MMFSSLMLYFSALYFWSSMMYCKFIDRSHQINVKMDDSMLNDL